MSDYFSFSVYVTSFYVKTQCHQSCWKVLTRSLSPRNGNEVEQQNCVFFEGSPFIVVFMLLNCWNLQNCQCFAVLLKPAPKAISCNKGDSSFAFVCSFCRSPGFSLSYHCRLVIFFLVCYGFCDLFKALDQWRWRWKDSEIYFWLVSFLVNHSPYPSSTSVRSDATTTRSYQACWAGKMLW